MPRKAISTAICVALGLTLLATPAGAKPPPVTKMSFKLDAHEVQAGEAVTGGVSAWTRSGNQWVPLPQGTMLSVQVDGLEVGTVATDVDGYADVSYAAAGGEHVMKVVFAGDVEHKRAQRAQGFEVAAAVAPDAPVLTGSSPSTGLVVLDWIAPANDGGSPITGYSVYRGDASNAEVFMFWLPETSFTTNDIAAASGSTVFYVVTASNAVGESVWSNEVTVTVT